MENSAIFRLITTSKQSANYNMALDKALTMAFQKNNQPILRLYTWENSFSVGVSQETKTYFDYYKTFQGNCAKRMTGGGVLFHGHDLSYSLVLPVSYLENLSVKQSYETICLFLLTFYKNLNLTASYAKDIPAFCLSKSDFCQMGCEAYDIIIQGIKMGGNAQRRTKNIIFQHGSIPIFKTLQTKEFGQSLEDLGIKLSFEDAQQKLIDAFMQTFNVQLTPSYLHEQEEEYLHQLLKESNNIEAH